MPPGPVTTSDRRGVLLPTLLSRVTESVAVSTSRSVPAVAPLMLVSAPANSSLEPLRVVRSPGLSSTTGPARSWLPGPVEMESVRVMPPTWASSSSDDDSVTDSTTMGSVPATPAAPMERVEVVPAIAARSVSVRSSVLAPESAPPPTRMPVTEGCGLTLRLRRDEIELAPPSKSISCTTRRSASAVVTPATVLENWRMRPESVVRSAGPFSRTAPV